MKRIRVTVQNDKTFGEGFEEYVLDMKARNLREGTIRHYQQAIKQIYKRIPEDTPISQMSEKTMPQVFCRPACCLELLKPFHHLPWINNTKPEKKYKEKFAKKWL